MRFVNILAALLDETEYEAPALAAEICDDIKASIPPDRTVRYQIPAPAKLHEFVRRLLDPLDLSQWEFYVVKTSEIDQIFGERSSISINQVKTISKAYSANGLMNTVDAVFSA